MRNAHRLALVVSLVGAVPLSAANLGSLQVGDKAIPLVAAYAFVPRYDLQGLGKAEVTVLLSSLPLDGKSIGGWASPANGAFEQVVRTGRGALVEVGFIAGLKPGRVSVYGVGYTLGDDSCQGCVLQAAYSGAGLKGSAKTGAPLELSGTKITFGASFDVPKPAPPSQGDALAGGGEPGKAFLEYVKAYQEGNYEALQRLMPEGKAEDKWGYYSTPEERQQGIQSSAQMEPKSAKILRAWRAGDSAIVIVEIPHPFGGAGTMKAVVGLGFDGKGWRVRERYNDLSGRMIAD